MVDDHLPITLLVGVASRYHVSGGDSVWSVWLWKVSAKFVLEAAHSLRLTDKSISLMLPLWQDKSLLVLNFMCGEAIGIEWRCMCVYGGCR